VPVQWGAINPPVVQPGNHVVFGARKEIDNQPYSMDFTVNFGWFDNPTDEAILDGVGAIYDGLVAAGWTVQNCVQISDGTATRDAEPT
jgi:hypothetical protein